jgi:3-isopropylmalate/(R)-2-methylmalate dehydratase small subunit
MKPIKRIESCTVVLPTTDIDTDQIMPARFLTTTSREGLGDKVFYDLRFDDNGTPRSDFPLNTPDARDCSILVAGRNFGCGSSREHAPWGLLDHGFEAVISSEIADIFRNNALKNGLVAIVVNEATHEWLLANPGARVIVDVESMTLTLPHGHTCEFELDNFSRYCLLEGTDQLGFLQRQMDQVESFEEMRPWKP